MDTLNAVSLTQLITAIRNADSLEELQRLVGPSDEEEAQAKQRLSQIDTIWNRCNGDLSALNVFTKDRYDQLMLQQTEFENKYC